MLDTLPDARGPKRADAASGIDLPKPPVPVDGVPLLELDVRWLLRPGLCDVEMTRIHDRHVEGEQTALDSLRRWTEQGQP